MGFSNYELKCRELREIVEEEFLEYLLIGKLRVVDDNSSGSSYFHVHIEDLYIFTYVLESMHVMTSIRDSFEIEHCKDCDEFREAVRKMKTIAIPYTESLIRKMGKKYVGYEEI